MPADEVVGAAAQEQAPRSVRRRDPSTIRSAFQRSASSASRAATGPQPGGNPRLDEAAGPLDQLARAVEERVARIEGVRIAEAIHRLPSHRVDDQDRRVVLSGQGGGGLDRRHRLLGVARGEEKAPDRTSARARTPPSRAWPRPPPRRRRRHRVGLVRLGVPDADQYDLGQGASREGRHHGQRGLRASLPVRRHDDLPIHEYSQHPSPADGRSTVRSDDAARGLGRRAGRCPGEAPANPAGRDRQPTAASPP